MSQKPYTNYECASGQTGQGHSSLWTGASPSNRRENCCCGQPYVEVVSDGHRYKVVFESIRPHQAEAMVSQYGRGVWQALTNEQWDALDWLPPTTSDQSTPNSLRAQYERLLECAQTHEQPIRNVHFFKARATEWEEVGTEPALVAHSEVNQ